MRRVYKVISNIDLAITTISFAILICLTFLGVIFRYFFSSPWMWLEEVQLWCFVWIVFFGASMAFRIGGHVSIEVIVDALPEKISNFIEKIDRFIVVAILATFFVLSIRYTAQMVSIQRVTSILRIPYYMIYGAVPFSIALMLFNYIVSWFDRKDSADEGGEENA